VGNLAGDTQRAGRQPLVDDRGAQIGARGIHGRGCTRRPAANDDDVVLMFVLFVPVKLKIEVHRFCTSSAIRCRRGRKVTTGRSATGLRSGIAEPWSGLEWE